MNLNSRIKAIQIQLDVNKELYGERPEFEKWNEAELKAYNQKMLEAFHKENAIRNYEDAKKRLHYEFVNGLISEDEYNLMLEGEKEFWKL